MEQQKKKRKVKRTGNCGAHWRLADAAGRTLTVLPNEAQPALTQKPKRRGAQQKTRGSGRAWGEDASGRAVRGPERRTKAGEVTLKRQTRGDRGRARQMRNDRLT